MPNRSSWLVAGRAWDDETITINVSAEVISASEGGLYLINPSGALSLLQQVEDAMTSAGVGSASAVILGNRNVRLSGAGVFTITWGVGTRVRDLLGFTGDLAAASSYEAPLHSPLLWSPGRPEIPELSPLGTTGGAFYDVSASVAPGGVVTSRTQGSPIRKTRLTWRHIERARYWISDEPMAGCFTDFHGTSLVRAERWLLVRNFAEDGTTTPVDLGAAQFLGPYKSDLQDRGARQITVARSRGYERVEQRYDVTVQGIATPEFGEGSP